MYQKKFCKKTVETMKTTCVSFLAKIEPQLLLVALSCCNSGRRGGEGSGLVSKSNLWKKRERKTRPPFPFSLFFFPLPLPASRKEFGGAGGQKEEKGGGRKKAHEMRLGGGGRGEAQGTTCLFLHFLRDEITNFSRFF